ncbi:hypothetical protein POSPLADRAFT_1047583 [Postia placenta MAD-698-R-SB12]|uniref:1-alkyl-2-acetylglycerophosphocholine esterase n=1 Tax=Postia placenta MAD-698-R-SB12 TaxID=670580 RepID=A0A1X6MUW2_9APHY|nr:hypothetical protein POSPLADRAFT_1047583 [Postia placenta MAD-698-R-SB12]OSX60109.1 hypothetical protein POSPLADRAFT_1047583 [Postia placenta MAD-698-R-SB12]
MFTLPDIPGRYPVGATTFAVPLESPQAVGSAKLRHSSGNTPYEPALLLEEVVFTVFYPADLQSPSADGTQPEQLRKTMDWVPKPVKGTLRGYAHFAKLPFWLSAIPVYPDVPLLDPAESSDDPEAQWPLVFFSHGLSGTRTTYSHLCIRLASEGKVVISMEHRDGTAPVVMSHFSGGSQGKKGKRRRRPKVKYYLHPEDIFYEGDGAQSKSAFRADQLLFRRIEVYLAYKAFSDLVDAHPRAESGVHVVYGYKCYEMPKRGAFWQSWAAGHVQCRDDITYIGHSFGGALVVSLHALLHKGARFEPLPITHALVLDPWLEPLATPGPAPHVEATRDARAPSILVLNSEEFTLWPDHFARLEGVVRAWRQDIREANHVPGEESQSTPVKLLTLVRAKHVSFSDFGVIWPLGHASRDGRIVLKIVGDLAIAFLGGELREALQGIEKRDMEIEHTKKGSLNSAPPALRHRKLVGHIGEVIVH